ncbi:MAG: RAD55 family ATPase, partial [Candidatus Freyarchaeota archaeon]
MVLASTIPKEISEALESTTFSLHIKGSAGTGKTTMALELVRYMNCPAIYLSTRVSPSRLYNQFPWSETCLHKENILDANTSLDLQTREETLFEYVDRPSFLKNLYSRVLEAKKEHLAIIVDSVDYLKSNLRIPQEDLSVERDILDIAERVNANAIFISETCEESKLDYLVDGVVRLERDIVNERLLRKLYIEKIRRNKIENPMYLFTLKDGRFRCFENGLQINFIPREAKLEQKEGRKIPTLVPELDQILGGGFEKVSFNIFEVGENVGMAHFYIFSPIFFNIVLQGYPVFSIPSKSLFSTDVVKMVPTSDLNEKLVSTLGDASLTRLRKCFHVFLTPENHPSPTETYNTHHLKGQNPKEDLNNFTELAKKVLEEVKAETLVVTMASDTMEYVYGTADLLKIIQTWMEQIKKLNGVM